MKILLIGSGYMATEYLKVLDTLDCEVTVVGRGQANIDLLKSIYPKHQYFAGGISNYLATHNEIPEKVINAVNVVYLEETTSALILAGAKHILLEKPGSLSISGLQQMQQLAESHQAQVHIAYNRRFYSSVATLIEMAAADGGISSIQFEFTEWIHTIDEKIYGKETLEKWIIANSSHVIDTAFYLAGLPQSINCIVKENKGVSWHPSGSIFIGSGITDRDIPFSYHTNWEAPGRWAIEVLTNKNRYYLKPMEGLGVQPLASVRVNPVEIENQLDKDFKPGLHKLTSAFINGDMAMFCSLEEQMKSFEVYAKISNYQLTPVLTD